MTDENRLLGDEEPHDGDSAILTSNIDQPHLLKVYSAGEVTVVGFGETVVPPEHNLAQYREEIDDLIRENATKVFAFDLTGVVMVPSSLLGLMITLHKRGLQIEVYNPSDDVAHVLRTTHLDMFVNIKQVPL